MSKNLKKILISGASLLMIASVGAEVGDLSQPVHAESNISADNTLDSVLYSGWKHHQIRIPGFAPDPVDLVYVHGHRFIYDVDRTHGILVDGRMYSYKRGLSLYYKYSTVHHHRVRRHAHYYSKNYIRKFYKKLFHKAYIPKPFVGNWSQRKNGSGDVISFKPFTRHVMNKLIRNDSAKQNTQIIKKYKILSYPYKIKYIGHNQYVFTDKAFGITSQVKITLLHHNNELKVSGYGNGISSFPVKANVYYKNAHVSKSKINDLPYGIGFIG